MFDCTVVGITQEMNLETNVSSSFLVLRLPDGKVVRAAIDAATTETVVEYHVHASGVPTSDFASLPSTTSPVVMPRSPTPPAAPAQVLETEPSEVYTQGDTFIFGGQDDAPASPQESPPAAAQPLVAPIKSNIQRLPNGKVIVPSKQGERDEYGYPRGTGVDASDVTGSFNIDEDGTASV